MYSAGSVQNAKEDHEIRSPLAKSVRQLFVMLYVSTTEQTSTSVLERNYLPSVCRLYSFGEFLSLQIQPQQKQELLMKTAFNNSSAKRPVRDEATDQPTPRSRVLFKKLTVRSISKKKILNILWNSKYHHRLHKCL